MCESRSRTTSWPARVWLTTETRLPIVPDATKRPAALPSRSAAIASRRLTVGSSSHTSSPTSARAIASRISGVGRVRVSERRSTMSCTGFRLVSPLGPKPLDGAPAPLGVAVLAREPAEEVGGLGVLALVEVHFGEEVEGLGNHERARIPLEHEFEPLARRARITLREVVVGDPHFLLHEPPAADVDLGERLGRVAALRVFLDELPELIEGPLGEPLVLFDRLHLVVIAHREAVLDEVGDLVAGEERHERLELLDRLVELCLAIIGLADQKARARGVGRVRVALDDLLEVVAGHVVTLGGEFLRPDRIELLRGEDRRRGGPEPAAPARDQEQACEKYPHAHKNLAPTYSTFCRQKLFDFRGDARYYENTQEASPMAWPRMLKIRQTFPRPRVTDIPRTVAQALGTAGLPIKRGDAVAVGAGSRGIANIDVIVGATVRWLRDLGARPFVFPAMGSHGGGTPEGQLSVLAHYGITEATMGCPIRATMDVVQVGEALGLPVWLDRYAAEADWIGLVNRVKPHTDFKGSIESGIFKMMTIGLGKYQGAIQYHRANIHHGYETVITSVGREVLSKSRIGFGLGIVENGYDETARIEAFTAENLEAGERHLLKDAREWMARLPFSPMDVLIVEEIGKNISGAGMDTNVIGRPSNPHEPFPADPRILWIVALDLTEESYGNAVGIGNADFTTRRLVEKIDMKPTLINCITACTHNGAKIPATYDTDREAIETALSCVGLTPPERARVIRIKNTLMLGEIEVSEAFLPEVAKRADLTRLTDPAPLAFDAAGRLTPIARD